MGGTVAAPALPWHGSVVASQDFLVVDPSSSGAPAPCCLHSLAGAVYAPLPSTFTMADALAVPSHFMEATASRHVQAPVVVAQPTVDPTLFAPPALDASAAAHVEYCRAAVGKGVSQVLIGESESPDFFRKGEASRCPWMDLERRRPVACACGRRPHWSHDARQGTRVAGSGCRGGVPGPWPRPGPVPCVWLLSVAEVCVVCAVCGVWCVVSARGAGWIGWCGGCSGILCSFCRLVYLAVSSCVCRHPVPSPCVLVLPPGSPPWWSR